MQSSLNGTIITYEEYGTGPAVLLFHDFTADHQEWKSQVHSLILAGYRVIVPLLGGLGSDLKTEGKDGVEAQNHHVICLLNYLGIGRAAIIDLSPGAGFLNSFVQRHAQRVAAAVAFDVSRGPAGKEITRSLLEFFQGAKRFRSGCQVFRQVA